MSDYINVDLNANHETPKFPLGTLGSDNGGKDVFKYCKYNDGDGAGTPVVGYYCVGLDSGYPDGEVTDDVNSATIKAIIKKPGGFMQRVMTDGYCGWFQVWGRNRQNITTPNDVAQGNQLMAHATSTGTVSNHDDTAAPVIAVALEDDGTTTATVLDPGQAFIMIER